MGVWPCNKLAKERSHVRQCFSEVCRSRKYVAFESDSDLIGACELTIKMTRQDNLRLAIHDTYEAHEAIEQIE